MEHTEHPNSGQKPGMKSREGWRSALSTIAILVLAPLVAILLTSFVFQSYEVDGPSMEPTLEDGDRLIVWKVPRTVSRITGNAYIPGRGEVIVFSQPLEDGGSGKQLIKRVIALPGERIAIRDNQITIYNAENPEGFSPNIDSLGKPSTEGNIDLVVPEDQVFAVGDNRANSLDSRVFGAVPVEHIAGNLVLRIFPFNQIETF